MGLETRAMEAYPIRPDLYWRMRYCHTKAEQARAAMDDAVRELMQARAAIEAEHPEISFRRKYRFVDADVSLLDSEG